MRQYRTAAGRIAAMGEMAALRGGASEKETVLDMPRQAFIPGLVDAHCHLGMWVDGLGFDGDDGKR